MKILVQSLIHLTCIQIVFILFAAGTVTAQNIPDMVLSTVRYMQKNEFENIAPLYHFPTYYSESQLIEERKGIRDALELLSKEFGQITEIEINHKNYQLLKLGVSCGDIDFLKSHPHFMQYVFEANFSILGKGFVVIQVNDINGESKLRSIGYALSASPKNAEVLRPIVCKFMELMFHEKCDC